MDPKCLPVEKTIFFQGLWSYNKIVSSGNKNICKCFGSHMLSRCARFNTFECKDKCKVDNAHITVPSV